MPTALPALIIECLAAGIVILAALGHVLPDAFAGATSPSPASSPPLMSARIPQSASDADALKVFALMSLKMTRIIKFYLLFVYYFVENNSGARRRRLRRCLCLLRSLPNPNPASRLRPARGYPVPEEEEDGERAVLGGRWRKTDGARRFLRGCLRCKRFLRAWRPVNGSRSSLVKKMLIRLVMYSTSLRNNDSRSIGSMTLGMSPKSSISQTRNTDRLVHLPL
ncbi:hypothetical protein MUK42_04141 [Musa troglodytarum]|uniref:Uncharacterized protein n=1 Tax=Musa troglodytarum TaxID=320322 RepID=A0A9E7K9X0_9LILI|nr:hypothetical protein MUK42_04141 [Musa troglodytarum]